MNKADILNLFEGVEDTQDINDIILGHDEFKNLGQFDISKVGIEDYKGLLQSNESIKGYHQSLIDSAISKGVASYEEKTLPNKVQEELKKLDNKSKSPEQIRIEELEQRLNKADSDRTKAEMIAKYQSVLSEKKIPSKAIKFILAGDEETTDSNILEFQEMIQPYVDEQVLIKLGISGYTPPDTKNNGGVKNPWSKGQINLTEQGRIMTENPALASQLIASATK